MMQNLGLHRVPKLCYGVSILTVGFLIYYVSKAVKKPQLICAEGSFRTFVEDNVKIIKRRFWPTIWCFEGRAQTIFSAILRRRWIPKVHFRRELLTLQDGGEVALDWADQDCYPTSPIVIILPGLAGTSQAEYIRCFIAAAKIIGIRCVVFNNRGLAGVRLKTPRLYSAANYDDFTEVLNYIQKTHPHIPLGAAGISMGGMILGNYLAHHGTAAAEKLKAVFLLSVPWNIAECRMSIERPYLNLMLNRELAENLCKNFRKYHFSQGIEFPNVDAETVLKSRMISEFDANFTAKHFGYKDLDDYYEDATLHKKLHLIEVPTLSIHAADDPMVPLTGIPMEAARKSKKVALLLGARGGHGGFLEGLRPVGKESYIGSLFGQYFESVFKKMDRTVFA